MSKLSSGDTKLNKEVNSIIDLTPDNVIVSSIALGTGITLSGTSNDQALIYQYARDLLTTGYFASLNIQSISSSGDTYTFSLAITLK